MSAYLTIKPPSCQWTVYQHKTFAVQVYAWRNESNTEWTWNVYALIYLDHPLHQKADIAADSLRFHYGANFVKRIVTSPARAKRHDLEKDSDVLKIGNDYAHHGDYYEDSDPKDGIPPMIHHDAQLLVNELLEWLE